MARANEQLIESLREAASKVEADTRYNWGHVGRCNCGFLAQAVTALSPTDIYERARAQELDEWTEYANDYCPLSGAPMDSLIDLLVESGLDPQDIHDLEYLSNQKVLDALPGAPRTLQKSKRSDVALYMRTWAGLMELELKTLVHA